jgi:hypothetical protein
MSPFISKSRDEDFLERRPLPAAGAAVALIFVVNVVSAVFTLVSL